MKYRIITVFGLLLCVILQVSAEQISLSEALNNFTFYDKKEITIRGEALDLLPRAQGVWINIVDRGSSLGIWVDKSITVPDIAHFGSYQVRGDILEIKGTFHKQHPDFFEPLVAASAVRVVYPGSELKQRVSLEQKETALLAAVLFCLLFLLYLRRRERHG